MQDSVEEIAPPAPKKRKAAEAAIRVKKEPTRHPPKRATKKREVEEDGEDVKPRPNPKPKPKRARTRAYNGKYHFTIKM